MAMQALWRPGEVSNNALLIVECDGPLPTARIGRALDRFLEDCPWPAARLRRPFPWGALHWAVGARPDRAGPRVHHQALGAPRAVHAALEAQLNAAIDPRHDAPLNLLIADGPQATGARGGTLVLTWFHPLMDPRGAQNLLRHLSFLDRHPGRLPEGAPRPAFVPHADPRSYRERGRLARQSREHIRSLARVALVSPGTGLAEAGPARFRVLSWIDPAPRAPRTARDICARLAVVARAMADLSDRRGLPDAPFLVPIAVDLRPTGEPGPMFGNMLAFHFAQFGRADTVDVDRLARDLRREMADAVRDGHIEANAAALEFLRYRPLSAMLSDLPGTAAGETFSFNCADVGEFPGRTDSFFGRRVVNAYHVPAVMPRPGIGIFFNQCGPTTNMVTSWIEGAVTEDEVVRIAGIVRHLMRAA